MKGLLILQSILWYQIRLSLRGGSDCQLKQDRRKVFQP